MVMTSRESVRAAAMRMGRSEDEVRFRLLHDYEYGYDCAACEWRVRRRAGATPPKMAEFIKWLADNKDPKELPDAMRAALAERDRRMAEARQAVAPSAQTAGGGWSVLGIVFVFLLMWVGVKFFDSWLFCGVVLAVSVYWHFFGEDEIKRINDPNRKKTWWDKLGQQYGPGGWSPIEDIFIGGPEYSREWFCGCSSHSDD